MFYVLRVLGCHMSVMKFGCPQLFAAVAVATTSTTRRRTPMAELHDGSPSVR